MSHQETRLIFKHIDEDGYTNDIDCYVKNGGYDQLKKAVTMQPEDICAEVLTSGVRGRGGAGFPAGMKWKFLDRKSGKPIYLICNADESEPGTFKDRQIIHKDPHQLIEGMMLSAFAIQAKQAFIYIRAEFFEGAKILERAIAEAKEKGLIKELNNGRLAMIGILGFISEQRVEGSVPLLKGLVSHYDGETMAPFG